MAQKLLLLVLLSLVHGQVQQSTVNSNIAKPFDSSSAQSVAEISSLKNAEISSLKNDFSSYGGGLDYGQDYPRGGSNSRISNIGGSAGIYRSSRGPYQDDSEERGFPSSSSSRFPADDFPRSSSSRFPSDDFPRSSSSRFPSDDFPMSRSTSRFPSDDFPSSSRSSSRFPSDDFPRSRGSTSRFPSEGSSEFPSNRGRGSSSNLPNEESSGSSNEGSSNREGSGSNEGSSSREGSGSNENGDSGILGRIFGGGSNREGEGSGKEESSGIFSGILSRIFGSRRKNGESSQESKSPSKEGGQKEGGNSESMPEMPPMSSMPSGQSGSMPPMPPMPSGQSGSMPQTNGEQKPNNGEQKPNNGEQKPNNGEQKPNNGEQKPNNGEQKPQPGQSQMPPPNGSGQEGQSGKMPGENSPINAANNKTLSNYTLSNTVKWPEKPATSVDQAAFAFGSFYQADRTNGAVHVVGVCSGSLITTIKGFEGCKEVKKESGPSCDENASGPNGLLVVPSRKEVWVGDGNGKIRIIDTQSHTITATVNVTTNSRADELAYDAVKNIVFAAFPGASPPFGVFIDAETRVIKKKLDFPDALDGLEQPVWNAKDGNVYLAVPKTKSNPFGEVKVISTESFSVNNILPEQQCIAHGIAFNNNNQIYLGCSEDAIMETKQVQSYIIDSRTGATISKINGVSGTDQVTFDSSRELFFAAAGRNTPSPFLAIIDSKTGQIFQTLNTTRAISHAVAVDSDSGSFMVPTAEGMSIYRPSSNYTCSSAFSARSFTWIITTLIAVIFVL